MAEIKISQLTAAASANGSMQLETNDAGTSKRVTVAQILTDPTIAGSPTLSAGTANGVLYLNGSKVAASGSAITFDGTNFATTGTATATKLIPTGNVTAGNGMYLPTTNTLAWSTNGAEVMRIDGNGSVGIGTSSPVAKLDVQAAGAAIQIKQSATGSATYYVMDNTVETGGKRWRFGYTGAAGIPLFSLYNQTDNVLAWAADASGEVYIAGTTDQGAYNLQCNGTGVWGAGAYVNGSDERIKDDIAPIESGLDVVEKLNPVTYRYKKDWSKDQSVQTGFIAQELLVALEGKNYVESVVQQGGSEGYYSVAYQNIIPILTKAIQELKAELDATKVEVAALKGN